MPRHDSRSRAADGTGVDQPRFEGHVRVGREDTCRRWGNVLDEHIQIELFTNFDLSEGVATKVLGLKTEANPRGTFTLGFGEQVSWGIQWLLPRRLLVDE